MIHILSFNLYVDIASELSVLQFINKLWGCFSVFVSPKTILKSSAVSVDEPWAVS